MSDLLQGGERRNLSVLVIDMVGSTPLASQLDPEDFDDLYQSLGQLWQRAIDDVDGHVLKWTGDGLMAVFGYPHAHDNDAARATAAALSAIDLTNAAREADPTIPHLRLGLHTGLALVKMVGSGSSASLDIAGDTPAIAVRLEGHAPEDGLVVSDATAALIADDFDLQPLGPQELKGIEQPVDVFRVEGRRRAHGVRRQHRMIGRDGELDVLTTAWDRAREGERRAAVITADAGYGKSRLVDEFERVLVADGFNPLVLRCSELMGSVAWYPIIELIRDRFDWFPGDPDDALLEQLRGAFGDLGIADAHLLVARAIGAEIHADDPTSKLDPSRRRALLIETFLAWITRRAQTEQPTCVILEDLHWADPSTLEVVAPLVTQRDAVPLMTVITSRPTPAPLIELSADTAEISLDALDDTESIELVEEVAQRSLPVDVIERILDRCDQVPLFLTEIATTVAAMNADEGDGDQATDDVPLSLSDSLMMRLDRLGSVRSLAAVAATIGRTFDAQLLQQVAETGEVDAGLERMVDSGILVRGSATAANAAPTYTFGHALVREAAYNSVTHRTRRQWHGRIADAMSARTLDFELAIIAHHLTEARRIEDAIGAWNSAASSAFANAAFNESIAQFERGLALVPDADPSVAPALEFGLRLGGGLAYATRFGYQSVEAEQSYQRADELAAGLDGVEGFPALVGLWGYYQVRSDASRLGELSERCHRLSTLTDDPAVRLEGLSALSTYLAFTGQTDRAEALVHEAFDVFEQHRDEAMTFYMPQHPIAAFCGNGAPLAWCRGDFGTGWERHRLAMVYAERPEGVLGPFSSAHAYTFAAWFAALRNDPESAATHAKSAMAVAEEHGFLVWLGASVPHLGIATALLGDPQVGAAMIQEGVAGWRAAGSELFVSYFQHGLGLALEASGEHEPALAAVADGVEHAERYNERFHLAELHRLAGRLHTALDDGESASSRRRDAVRVAHDQGARLFELRALVDLVESDAATEVEHQRTSELAGLLADQNRDVELPDAIVDQALLLTGRSS